MSATLAQPIHAADRTRVGVRTVDSGARLSNALLSYLVVLITVLSLLPFQFAMPASVELLQAVSPLSAMVVFVQFVAYGFLTRRARVGRIGRHLASILLSAGTLALALESAQLFLPGVQASLLHVVTAMLGAAVGALLCERVTGGDTHAHTAVYALLLQLPLMGLVYLLLPLLWATAATAQGDPQRLCLTLAIGLMGASILGSIARAVRGFTPNRAWWMVPLVVLIWIAVGVGPALLVSWREPIAITATVTIFGSWRGRWSAPAFTERRYEVPSLFAAMPFLAAYFIGAGIWPGQSFRSYPLMTLGFDSGEAGLALALPLFEAGIAATVLGYVVAEFYGRSEMYFREGITRVLGWVVVLLMMSEVARSFFGYEGANLVRTVISICAATYGAGLYHLQRNHVKVVAHRVNHGR
jgi:hypothetical protein